MMTTKSSAIAAIMGTAATGAAAAQEEEGVPGVAEQVGPLVEKLHAMAHDALLFLPLLGVALAVLAVFALLARQIGRWQGLYRRLTPNPFLRNVLRQLVRSAVFLIGVLIALELLEATALVGAVLGTAGVLGVALGFAFRDLIENYIASVLLSLRQPFAPNDLVEIDGRCGTVARLTSRATVLLTPEGNHLRIPNAAVFKGIILNYTRNPHRRFDFGVGVGVGEDLGTARALGIAELERTEGVLDNPAPHAVVEELGDSNVLMRFYGWVDQHEYGYTQVKSEAIRRVKVALDDAGIDMPEPIYRVKMVEGTVADAGARPAAKTVRDEREVAPGKPREPAEPAPLRESDAVERQVAQERAADGEDLLDPAAPRE